MVTCSRCGRVLRNPASRSTGIGPRCAKLLRSAAEPSDEQLDLLKPLSLNASETEFISLRESQLSEIARTFSIPMCWVVENS